MKKCSTCGIEKDLTEFNKNRSKKDGLKSYCRDCSKKKTEEYEKRNPDKRKEYRAKNKEKINIRGKKYRKENKDKIKQRKIIYYNKNKEKINESCRKYYKLHRATNPQYKIKKRLMSKIYWENNPQYKIAQSLRRRNRHALKSQGVYKSDSTKNLLGCTWEEARIHIENQFQPGMSWENWTIDGWHLDHIRPCSSFDLTDPEQQKQCFHYTNLQPLWAFENLSKSDKWNAGPRLDAL